MRPWNADGRGRLALALYALALRLAVPAYLARVWSRGRVEPAYRDDWCARLGWYGAAHRRAAESLRATGQPVVWVHAVSLGEARAAAPLVAALRQACPDLRLLLTHTTATGREAGRTLLAGDDLQTWLPYDTPGAVRRFLRLHRPAVGVLMETEVWPVLQRETARAGVPMVLANARLSDKSLRQGERLGALMRPAARSLSAVLAQTQADADRMLRLLGQSEGGPVVSVCGNVKYDMAPSPALLAQGRTWRAASGARALVLAASTREGEELGLLEAWKAAALFAQAGEEVLASRPRLLIVPRHPQRFEEVAALVARQGWTVSRRSQWPQGQPDSQALQAEVWLGDSMGEMPAYYAAARVALLGGSFAPLGGQNLIEAAACGCPVVMGPSTFNFAEAAVLSEAAGAARRVADWTQAVDTALAWCASPAHDADVQRCLAFNAQHRGAAARMAASILDLAKAR